jgi:ribosomal protein L13
MKTLFPKKECHVPKWFVIDAEGQTLGRLATEVSKLLRGKEICFIPWSRSRKLCSCFKCR